MLGVFATAGTEFFKNQFFGGVNLVLRRRVIVTFTNRTRQLNDEAISFLGHKLKPPLEMRVTSNS